MSNTFGRNFRITTYGESHGAGIGVVIDGCPAGLKVSIEDIQRWLDRRRPGQSKITTPRQEKDQVVVQSGIYQEYTLGTPIGLFIANQDQKSADYDDLKNLYRPGHADLTYDQRYGIRDFRGGGRSSNRESAARVAAGAVAAKLTHELVGLEVLAWVDQVAHIQASVNIDSVTFEKVESQITRCPDLAASKQMEALILQALEAGDSLGGAVKFVVKNCPAGVGSPIYHKLSSEIAAALMSINATKSVAIGLGAEVAKMRGSEHNDEIIAKVGKPSTRTNRAGGLLGGISNGEHIYGSLFFKPTATIKKKQNTITQAGQAVTFSALGRHDPCVLPRAVPIVEAMLQLLFADHLLEFANANVARLKKTFI